MRMKILTSLFIFFIFGACSSPEKPETPIPMMMIHIEGVVIDATTNRPIEGARITVYDFAFQGFTVYFRVAADHEGHYSIHEPFPRERCSARGKLACMKAEKPGYKTLEYTVFDDPFYGPRCTTELQKIDFQLEPY